MMEVTSRAISGDAFTTNCSSAMVWSAQVKTFCETASLPPTASVAAEGGASALAASRGTQVTSTVSPSSTWETALPFFSTTPVASCPSNVGRRLGRCI